MSSEGWDIQEGAGIIMSTEDMGSDVLLRCDDLSILTPDGSRTILGNMFLDSDDRSWEGTGHSTGIDLQIQKGDKLIVVGSSGCGKSSLMRAISGLWQKGHGTITWNSCLREDSSSVSAGSAPSKAFFLPQKPYNFLGTLREQIMYPSTNIAAEASSRVDLNSHLLELLDKVELGDLAQKSGMGDALKGLDVELDWSKVLSLGEQQRLAFARVLFNKPQVVVLDESTSALPLQTERTMYNLLDRINATYVSVGHRPSLLQYHNKKLFIGPVKAEMSYVDSESLEVATTY